jgi:hypothetical protein
VTRLDAVTSGLRILGWAVASGGLALLAFLLAATAATALSDWLGGGNPLRVALAIGLWTLGAATLPLLLARALLGDGYAGGQARPIFALVIAGALAAALAEAALVVSAGIRYGPNFEADYVGLSLLMPPAITVLTACTAAALATRGSARMVCLWGAAAALVGLALLALDSLPGVRDGISESGWSAGLAFALAAAFAVFVIYVLLRLPRDREASA